MSFWNKKHKSSPPAPYQAEIEEQKKKLDKASMNNIQANTKVVELVKNNGFTVIIAASMGAQHREG